MIVLVALALRLPNLAQRPMHTDEAVHAIKFGELLEKNYYQYDPFEYHGPTLNYFTLIPAWISSAKTLADVNEVTLRIVPVFFGMVLILLFLWLTTALGRPVVLLAALLTAVSPAMTFYSRYYIQETLLVCFTFGFIVTAYRYIVGRKILYALLSGLFFGLMYATKETWLIAFGAMLLALALTILTGQREKAIPSIRTIFKPLPAAVFALTAFAVAFLFYSSFFTNPAGIVDSIRTFTTYFDRAGNNQWHVNPWYFFIKILLYSHYDKGPVWSEAFIVLLTVVGFVVVLLKREFLPDRGLGRFFAFYTLILLIIYSAIPYKTPWLLLGFLQGMIVLAAIGAVALWRIVRSRWGKILLAVLLVGGTGHLVYLDYLTNFKYYADSRNPYVYAHTGTDVFVIVKRVQEIVRAAPEGNALYIQVICPNGDYWPLPWYFRALTHVGWYDKVDMEAPAAPLILASPSVEQDLMKKLYLLPPPGQKHLYLPLFDSYVEIRPNVELRGYVRKDLWDRYSRMQAETEVQGE